MLKYLAVIVLVLVAGVLIYAFMQPGHFRVERSATIRSAPEAVFPLINDFHRWEPWSPWEKIDPQLKRTYSGAQEGRGAIYEWSGNRNVGHGRMEIVESDPPARILIRIDFFTPFEAHNTVEFRLEGQGDSTVVTQAMYGPSPFVSRIMGLFFSMDKMVGEKYEEGLANLARLAEGR